jgi:hypothetical protein
LPYTRRSFLKAGPAAALAGQAASAAPAAPRIVELNGRKTLFVDGRPFLILGLQWDCDSCFAPEIMDPLFPEAAKLGCNTAVLPLYWREIEPQEGTFHFTLLDHRLEQARREDLRIVRLKRVKGVRQNATILGTSHGPRPRRPPAVQSQ